MSNNVVFSMESFARSFRLFRTAAEALAVPSESVTACCCRDVAVTAALLVRQFVLQQFAVSGHSMDTTLHDGDRVLVNKLSYHLHDPRRGDIVVLKTLEGAGERDLIKRVVALPGETIEYRSCVLYVDGKVLNEPYLDPNVVTPHNCGPEQTPLKVPANHVFVLGDNRGGSKDSRD